MFCILLFLYLSSITDDQYKESESLNISNRKHIRIKKINNTCRLGFLIDFYSTSSQSIQWYVLMVISKMRKWDIPSFYHSLFSDILFIIYIK